MTAFEQYFGGIYGGKIVACDKMKRLSEMLMERFLCPDEFHFDESIANRHIGFIETFCKLPSGKLGVPFKLELFQRARYQAVFGFVDDNDLRQYNEVLIIEGRKNGKALSLDTEIPTPNGFKKMADVHVGDEVYGDDGKPYKVTCESEIFMDHDCYRVTFRGGFSVVCDGGHLWRVKNKKGKIADRKTADLLHYYRPRKDGKGTEYLYRVPTCAPVEYDRKDLPIDPYTFGAWLGDGDSTCARITASDDDIDEMCANIERNGHTTKVYHNTNRASSIGIDVVGVGKENPMLTALRELGVIKNKHIPECYMRASIEQRFELLRGLMDTDGFCSKAGQCEFAQKSERIVDQVRELLSSLGIVSSKRKKTIRCNGVVCEAYSVLFFADKSRPCFRLERKRSRLKDHLNDRMQWNSIIGIEKVDSVPCKCISIDSPNHLYLATRNYIVTHNTSETAAVELDLLMNDGEGSPQIYNVATAAEQAKLGYNAVLKMRSQSDAIARHTRKRAYDLYCPINFGYIKPLSGNTVSLDGLDVHVATIDELAAIKNRDLYDLIKQGMGAREQPLLFCITTNGFVREGIFDAQYAYAKDVLEGRAVNKRFLPMIYELDHPSEWDKEDCWIKANPGLGSIKKLSYLREMVQKAKDDPSFKPTVMVKDFNIPQTNAAAWLRYEDLNDTRTFDLSMFDYGIGGFDAADTTDLNAAKCLFQRPGDDNIYMTSMYWIPEAVIEQQNAKGDRRERDGVPYSLWIEQGYMRTCPGNKCDKRIFLEWFKELRDKHDIYTMYIGYDPWHIDDTLLAEFKGEFGKNCMIPVRQGVYSLSQPMKDMAADFKAHRIIYNNNPIDRWCLYNTQVKVDVNNNIQPVKMANPTQRIDGAVAAIIGYKILADKRGQYVNMNREADEENEPV